MTDTTRIPADPPLRSTYDVFVNTLSRAIAEKLSEDSGDEEHERYLKAIELQTKAPKSKLTTEIQYAVYLRSGLFDEENYSDAEVARIIIDLAMDHAVEALKVVGIALAGTDEDGRPIIGDMPDEESVSPSA